MIIGLTGCFGCGKSTALKIFASLGAYTLSADSIVHDALREDDVKESISRIFGPDVIINGKVDRKALSGIVFTDNEKRSRLEDILHPIVFNKIEQASSRLLPERNGILMAEIPLLFETGYEKDLDMVITIKSSQDIVNDRLKSAGFSESDIRSRTAAHLPLKEKASKADIVIDNSGSLEELESGVKKTWQDLLKR